MFDRSFTAMLMLSGLTVALAAAAAPGQFNTDGAKPLAQDRWHDASYGISLRPPLDTHVFAQTGDRTLVRFMDPAKRYTIALSVSRSTRIDLTIDEVVEFAKKQADSIHQLTKVVGERRVRIGDHDAAVIYFEMPENVKRTKLLVGQALIRLDVQTYAKLEISGEASLPYLAPTFEAVLESMRIKSPQQLNEEREAAINAGHQWRLNLRHRHLHAKLIPEQLFRIVQPTDGGRVKEIGYMKIQQFATQQELKKGVAVRVQWRMVHGATTLDSQGEYFLADDDSAEMWRIVTTERNPAPPAGAAAPGRPATMIETGVRSIDQITVTYDDVDGIRKTNATRPEKGYLSQVEALMLGQLLPSDQPAKYGFYCYHSRQRTLALRTDALTPTLGGFMVVTRRSLTEPVVRARYDREGRLIERELGPTTKLLPTTAAELKRLWPGG